MCYGILEDRENKWLKVWMVLNVFWYVFFIVKKKKVVLCWEYIKVFLFKNNCLGLLGLF